MALISCPDCSKGVSSNAPACPNCGSPIRAQTIEQTGKEYKTLQVLGTVVAVLGAVFLGANVAEGNEAGFAVGAILTVLGLVLAIAGKIGAWWHHG